jgi:hypothetical protein
MRPRRRWRKNSEWFAQQWNREGFDVNLVLEQDSARVDDSEVQNQTGVGQRRITWTGPLGLVVGRSALLFAAPARVAGIFALRGSPTPWRPAAPRWTVYGTLVDIGCLALMWMFTRRNGLTLRDLFGPIRWHRGRDWWMDITGAVMTLQRGRVFHRKQLSMRNQRRGIN